MTAVSTYEVRRAGPRFGAEIFGVDFARDIDDATAERSRPDFLTHKVLVFRDQNLTPEQHDAAARIFGEPFDYPTAVRDETNRFVYPYNVEKTGKASTWHIGGLCRKSAFSIESHTYQRVSEPADTRCGRICKRRTTTYPGRSNCY
jgi:alpha-ketoglutarate-dependent sulfate ester dioxygenase